MLKPIFVELSVSSFSPFWGSQPFLAAFIGEKHRAKLFLEIQPAPSGPCGKHSVPSPKLHCPASNIAFTQNHSIWENYGTWFHFIFHSKGSSCTVEIFPRGNSNVIDLMEYISFWLERPGKDANADVGCMGILGEKQWKIKGIKGSERRGWKYQSCIENVCLGGVLFFFNDVMPLLTHSRP